MRRASLEDLNCSVAQSLEIIGEWWTVMILRDAFLGVTRFEQFQGRLGIARNVLSARLDGLVDHGVMERRVYDEARNRSDYVLTPKGQALWPVLVTLRQWGDEWVVGAGNESITLLHASCGQPTKGVLACEQCGEPLTLDQLDAVAGPGITDPDLLAHTKRAKAGLAEVSGGDGCA